METLIDQINCFLGDSGKESSMSWELRFRSYSPSQKVFVETKNYILRTASRSDLLNVFKLRSEVFLQDTLNANDLNMDLDKYDLNCDHLIIEDKRSGEICGTYRIILSEEISDYYSQKEFVLEHFFQQPGRKMEVGRACILINHRSGAVLDLLWKGIGAYAKQVNAKYIFGCSSVFDATPMVVKGIIHYLEQKKQLILNTSIRPKPEFQMKHWDLFKRVDDERLLVSRIPSLLRSYLNAGALVHGVPAWDREWSCFDFFTVLDIDKMSPAYKRRYMKNNSELEC